MYLNHIFEAAEGFLQMNLFRVCRDDSQISSIHNRSGIHGLTSELQVAQSQQDMWFYHVLQADLRQAAETADFHKVPLLISQIKCRRRTCAQNHIL